MNFNTELAIAEEIELTDTELKTATGGRGADRVWALVWTPNGPVWELVPAYWGHHDWDHHGWEHHDWDHHDWDHHDWDHHDWDHHGWEH